MNTVSFPVQNMGITHTHLFHFFSLRLKTTPTSLIQKGGMLHMHLHFPIGTRPHLAQKGGGHVPEMPPMIYSLESITEIYIYQWQSTLKPR